MKKRAVSVVLSLLLMTALVPAEAFASTGPVTDTVTYEADSPDKMYSFDEKIEKNGQKYKLSDVKVNVLEERQKTEEKEVTFTEKSEALPTGSEYGFEEHVERDGITYRLVKVNELKDEPYVQEVKAYTDYDYAVTTGSVPQTKTVTVKNEKTGKMESITCSLSDVTKTGSKWMKSHIDLEFQDYGSTAFYWQGILIANDLTSFPLEGHDREVLASVGLNENIGKVDKYYWTSDAYEKEDGLLYRNAKADIQKLVTTYRATYLGEIHTEEVVYEAVYAGKTIVEMEEKEYTLEAVATYEKDNSTLVLFAFILIILIFILLVILLVLKVMSREKEDRELEAQKEIFQKELLETEGK